MPVAVDRPPSHLVRYMHHERTVGGFTAWLRERAAWRAEHVTLLPDMHPQDRLYLGYTAGIPAELRVAEQSALYDDETGVSRG